MSNINTRIVQWIIVLVLTISMSTIAIAGQGKSENEPNDTKVKATVTTAATIIYGNLDDKDITDWFVLKNQLGPKIKLALSYTGKTSFVMTVYRDNIPVAKTEGIKPGESVTVTLKSKMYVKVQRISGASDYQIRITRPKIAKPKDTILGKPDDADL